MEIDENVKICGIMWVWENVWECGNVWKYQNVWKYVKMRKCMDICSNVLDMWIYMKMCEKVHFEILNPKP